ncbi:hypothetical protein PR202_gb27968 [Eleusine coracana subsp. coracana]|uniref:Uncharacterized protein n=1 Tax=Eleusine coracana subsp. coracana TaxID=191504 RepID=A0AAV5FVU4_ELECO|nr:hypothetical protein PR202_gb27968 [Eleusine coracana subsp. coracana]
MQQQVIDMFWLLTAESTTVISLHLQSMPLATFRHPSSFMRRQVQKQAYIGRHPCFPNKFGTLHQDCSLKEHMTSEATLKRRCSEVDLQCMEMGLAKRPATTLEFTDKLKEGMRYRLPRTVDHWTGMEEPRRGQSRVSSGLPQAPFDSTRSPSPVSGADPNGLRDLGRLFVLFNVLLQMRFITQRHDEHEFLGLLFLHLGAMLLILSLGAEQYPKQAAAGVAVVRALRNHLFCVF